MNEGIVILMIGISTLLGAIGLKFLDAVRYDNEEDLRDAKMMADKKKKRKKEYKPMD